MVKTGDNTSYFHQHDVGSGKDPKKAKKINSELSNVQTKYEGLVKMKHLLDLCDETVVAENIATWMRTLPQIILQVGDEHGSQYLAAENFKTLLSQACQMSSVSREVSATLIPTVLTSFIQTEYKDDSILTAIEALLVNYPTSCGVLRSRLVKYMIPLMMSSSAKVRTQAIGCWARVPFLGGGGSQRSTHLQQWQTQFDQTILSLKYAFRIFMGEATQDVLDPCIGSLSLPLTSLPNTEPELSCSVIQRICTLYECLGVLMNIDFPYAVSIPVRKVMLFILDVLDTVPGQLGNTSEMLHRASCLGSIQGSVLELFSRLTKICKRNICQYSSKINSMFSAMLDLWKDKNPIAGKPKRHLMIRTKIYEAISHWLQNCGPTSCFLCGPTHLNQSILKHIIDDITPTKNVLKVSTIQTHNNKKAKKRRFAEATQEMVNATCSDKIRDRTANSELCTETLRVVLHSLTTMGHRLSGHIHQTLQETIIATSLEIQQGLDVGPYSRCSPRFLLYKVLLALTMSPVPEAAPPIAISTRIFSKALSNEKNSEIKGYCYEAVASIGNVVHPWRSAWHMCSVVDIKNDTKKPDKTPTPIMEPMNIEMNICNELEGEEINHNESADIEEEKLQPNDVEDGLLDQTTESYDNEPSDEGNDMMKETETPCRSNGYNSYIESSEVAYILECDENEEELAVDDAIVENSAEDEPTAGNTSLDVTASQAENFSMKSTICNTFETCPDRNKEEDDDKGNAEINKMLLDFVDDAPPDCGQD